MKKKILVLTLALLITGSSLCSCTQVPDKTSESSASETTTVTSETSATKETAAETAATSETTTAVPNPRDTTPYEQVTLDGVKEHKFQATDFCFLESEKYVLFMEKDIVIPGDFAVNLDAIIGEIEDQLGLSACPDTFNYTEVSDCVSSHYGINPWEGWDIGSKIPIFLEVDRTDGDQVSSQSMDGFVEIVAFELFSDELWNSVPSYRDNPDRRMDCVDYFTFVHEITHTITLRNYGYLTKITAEGIAEYMGRKVIDKLADDHPSIAEYKEKRYLFDYAIPQKVNSKNAEKIFIGDYHEISHADRGPEYVYGRYLMQYLHETFGDDFYYRFNEKLKIERPHYKSNDYKEEEAAKYAEILKDLFGEDIFTRFGNWCVKKHHLQEKNGVFPGI